MAAVSVKRSIVDATCHRHVSRRIQSPVQKLCTTGTFCRLVRPDLSCYNCKTWVFKKYIYFYLYLSVKGWVEQNKAIVVDGKPISICTNLQRWSKFNDPLFTDQIPVCIKTADICKHGKTKSFYKIPHFLEQCLLTEAKPHQFQLHQEAPSVPDISKVTCK